MNKVKVERILLFITGILFFIATVRSGNSLFAAQGCAALIFAMLLKEEKSK